LLGKSVELEMARRGPVWHPLSRFNWTDLPALRDEIRDACSAFAKTVNGSRWQVLWCAGAGVIGTSDDQLRQETAVLKRVLQSLGSEIQRGRLGRGTFFLASSAGGLYAGATGPPFTEETDPSPVSPYGWNKLEQESVVQQWSSELGIPLLTGRISNLYGPGQNFLKSQGLITQVCLRTLTRQPLVLYVPLDTIRDYLYADDAAKMIADGIERSVSEAPGLDVSPPSVVKILASHQAVTIGNVLAEARRVMKRAVSVVLADSIRARHQAPDLRLKSVIWSTLDRRPKVTLGVGIQGVVGDLLVRHQRGALSA
jgi:UDP-glucose 4-epimerase